MGIAADAINAFRQDSRFAAVTLFLLAATLAKMPLIIGVTVGDIFYLAGCAVAARWVMENGRVERTRWNGLALLLVGWAMTGGVLAPILSSLNFSDLELAKSLARLSVLVAGALLIVALIQGTRPQWIGRLVLFVMTVNAAFAVGLYVAAWLSPGFFSTVGWLDRFTLMIPSPDGSATIGVIRARGLFNEPANLGLFQGLGVGYLAFVSRDFLNWFDWRKVLVLISIVLTMSLGAYALLTAVGLGLILVRPRKKAPRAKQKVVPIIATIMILAAAMIMLVQLGTNEIVAGRLTRVVAAEDLSAVGRLVGSWDVAYAITLRSPLVGSGVGNVAIAANGFGYTFEAAGRTLDGVPSWNVFAIALGSMGIGGLLLYSLLVLELTSRNVAAGMTIGVAGFTTGGLLVATIWVFFALYAAQYRSTGSTENGSIGRNQQQTAWANSAHASQSVARRRSGSLRRGG